MSLSLEQHSKPLSLIYRIFPFQCGTIWSWYARQICRFHRTWDRDSRFQVSCHSAKLSEALNGLACMDSITTMSTTTAQSQPSVDACLPTKLVWAAWTTLQITIFEIECFHCSSAPSEESDLVDNISVNLSHRKLTQDREKSNQSSVDRQVHDVNLLTMCI